MRITRQQHGRQAVLVLVAATLGALAATSSLRQAHSDAAHHRNTRGALPHGVFVGTGKVSFPVAHRMATPTRRLSATPGPPASAPSPGH